MIETRPKLATFDRYGALIDWATGIRAYFGEVLTEKDAGVDPETFYGRWYGRQLEGIFGPFKPYREVLQDSLRGLGHCDTRVPRGRWDAAATCGGARSRGRTGHAQSLDRPSRNG